MYDLASLDLTNSNLWEIESFTVKTAQPGNFPNSIFPIPEFDIPMFQKSRIIQASCYNAKAADNWYKGFYLKQVIGTPGGLSSGQYSEIQTVIVPVSNQSIIRTKLFFPSPAPVAWKLVAAVPWWHEEIAVTLWRYTGEVTPPLSLALQSIEEKINQLL